MKKEFILYGRRKGRRSILDQSKEKVKINPIFVHHTAVVARFVLNDSKRKALQLLFTIYAVRPNSLALRS